MAHKLASTVGAGLAAAFGVLALTCALDAAPADAATVWQTLSGDMRNGGATPSIARFGTGYEVVWVAHAGSSQSIQARLLDAAGKPLGSVITVTSGWDQLGNDPTILAHGTSRWIAFNGYHGGTNNPYNSDAEYYLTSSNGSSWTLNSGSLSAADLAAGATGTAVINDAGTVITGFAQGDGVRYHIGTSTQNPAPGTDPITQTTGNFSYYPGLGVDAANQKVWALWFSNGQPGVWAQVIKPADAGSLVRAPGSHSGSNAHGVQQDLSAASRIGGGLYTAYVTPLGQSIDVWRVGAATPLATIHDSRGPENLVLVRAPQGRLWLYWRDFQGGWKATRSNKAATRFGPVSTLGVPSGVSSSTTVSGVGSAGPLEAVASVVTSTGADKIMSVQVLPRLSISVSPASVARGHTFVATVIDAGDPVKGATVHFNGLTKTTNKFGKVSFTVPSKMSLGKHAVITSHAGYAGARTNIKVIA